MAFDPDAFLAGEPPQETFDPDSFLSDGDVEAAPQQEAMASGVADTALEFMAAVNRGAVSLADMPADVFNYLSEKVGSDVRAARLGDVEAVQAGTAGQFMEPGVARDIVSSAGEVIPAAVGTAATATRAAANLPRFTAQSEGLVPGLLRQAGQEGVGAAALSGAASGAGAAGGGALGEAVGGDVGRTVGEVVGGIAAPIGVGGAQALARRPSGIIPEQQATRFAQEQGLPLTTSDVMPPRTFAGRSAVSAAEKIPYAGTGGVREAQQAARSKVVEDYVQKFGEYRPEDIVSSLKASKSRIKQAAGRARQQYADQVSDQPAVNKAIQAIDDEVARLTTSPSGQPLKTADQSTVRALQDYRDDLIADPSFANLDRLRTTFREGVKGERMTVPNRSQAAMEKIYGAMTEDMDDVIRSNLGPDDAAKWKRANQAYANEAQQLKKTRLKSVLDKGDLTPETVNNLLYSNKPSEVKALYSSLSPKGKQAARAGLIAKASEKAADSPDRFLNELNKLSKQTDIVFSGADKKYLEGMKSYLQATKRAAEAGVLTKSGEQLFQIGAPAAAVGDVLGTGGVGLGATGAYGLMSRAYESAPVRKALQRLAASKEGTDSYFKALSDTSALLQSLTMPTEEPQEESEQ